MFTPKNSCQAMKSVRCFLVLHGVFVYIIIFVCAVLNFLSRLVGVFARYMTIDNVLSVSMLSRRMSQHCKPLRCFPRESR